MSAARGLPRVPWRAAVCAALLCLQMLGPANAEETCTSSALTYPCEVTNVETRHYSVGWDSGVNGTLDPANFTHPYDTFPGSIDPGQPTEPGVTLAGFHELLLRGTSFENGTAQPDPHSAARYTAPGLGRAPSPNSHGPIPALSYTLRLPAEVVMNGASSWYYRSPIAWDENFTRHFLDITDPTGRLVVARMFDTPDAEPGAFADNVAESRVVANRLYYRVDAVLHSDVNYTVTEYVETQGDIGINHLDVWTAEGQDIDGNGVTSYRVFPGTPEERIVDYGDPSFLFRFVYGTGVGGHVNLVRSSPQYQTLLLEANDVYTRTEEPVSGIANELRIVMPLRTTRPLNGTLTVVNNADNATCSANFTNATATLLLLCPISNPALWPAHVGPARLSVYLDIVNFTSAPSPGGCPQGVADTYGTCTILSWPETEKDPAAPDTGTYSLDFYNGSTLARREVHESSPWIEVYEIHADQPSAANEGSSSLSALDGAALIATGLILLATAIVAPYVVVSLTLAAAAGATGGAGLYLFTQGIAGHDGRLTLAAAWSSIQRQVGDIAAITAVLPCAGALVAPGFATKAALGAACVVLLGAGSALLQYGLDVPEIVMQGVEVLGQLLSSLAEVVVPVTVSFLELAAVMLGVFAIAYAILVPVKFALLFILAGLAALVHDGDPRTWPPFAVARDRFYLPGWTELIEQRLGLFSPQPKGR
ncbi:MAG: hypothetical protein ACYDDF_12550 [Thermoplasmatota archaeon]